MAEPEAVESQSGAVLEGQKEYRSFDPRNLRPLGPWILVHQDPDPTETPGGILIPETSKMKGKRNRLAKVVRVGSGIGKGPNGKGIRYKMPAVGNWVCYPSVASMPDTQKAIQWKGETGWFLLHVIDANLEIELEEGESLPQIE